jgi:LPXTG-motif cell wall-anchored protein
MQTSGGDAGRFSDKSDFGDFSNGFGQALATIALSGTSGGVPAAAVGFLLDQQCPGGGFRGDYTTSGGCTSDASATVDATGMALMALTAATPTCASRQATADAVDWLLEGQGDSGAFGGETGSNSNSTGLAAVTLRSLGQHAAADEAAAFIAGLQLESGDDVGAIALNAAGEASAADGIQDPERDGFRRASTQGVLAFGLPSYAELLAGPVDPADLAPCAAPPAGSDPSGELSTSTVAPGGTVTITAEGFEAGETVEATLHSTPIELGTTTADGDGNVTMTVTIPSDVEPGAHTVELRGLSSGRTVTLPLTIVGVEDPRALPATGRTTGPLATTGAALLAVGAAALLASRRRTALAGGSPR